MFVLDPTQQAVVTRFGQITRIEQEPGLYFKVPTDFIERVQLIEKRLLRFDLNNIITQVQDGRFYNVDAFVTYVVDNPRLFRERLSGSLIDAEQRINTQLNSALRSVYGKRGFAEALSVERNAMMEEAQDLIAGTIDPLGISIIDVRILRTDLTEQVSAQTFERMKAERLAEAANLRAIGTQQAQTIRAVADRQAVEIVAGANRQSSILRGEGDAERAAIFANAYGSDPDFFDFYRSMQAYGTAFQGDNTTMLLSPDSEFIRFFGGDKSVTLGGMNTLPGAPDTSAPSEAPATDGAEAPSAATEPATDGAEAPATGTNEPAAEATEAPAGQ
jgi:membrane protease subunit HflC